MGISGIDALTYGVLDLELCKRYFEDWGLRLVSESATEVELACRSNARIRLVLSDTGGLPPGVEPDPTIREVVWGVQSAEELDTLRSSLSRISAVSETADGFSAKDPNGLHVSFRVSQKQEVPPSETVHNVWGVKNRVDKPSPVYDRAEPIDINHVVFHTPDVAEIERWYTEGLGFHVTDRYPGRGVFMRCAARAGHHDFFCVQVDGQNPKLDHVAFTVQDIHEIFGGGVSFGRKGWKTEIGPGRHPISSAFFWYFKCPAGGKTEYSGDEDYMTEGWISREFQPSPSNYAEWAAQGEVDVQSRMIGSVARADAKTAKLGTDKLAVSE